MKAQMMSWLAVLFSVSGGRFFPEELSVLLSKYRTTIKLPSNNRHKKTR
ncbi:hypothetical protein DOX62_011585 [Cronobacter dublinensis]